MSDTPRTDKLRKRYEGTGGSFTDALVLCEALERELREMDAENDRLLARPEVAHIKEAINALPRLVPADLEPEDQANANGEYVSLFGVMRTLDSI